MCRLYVLGNFLFMCPNLMYVVRDSSSGQLPLVVVTLMDTMSPGYVVKGHKG